MSRGEVVLIVAMSVLLILALLAFIGSLYFRKLIQTPRAQILYELIVAEQPHHNHKELVPMANSPMTKEQAENIIRRHIARGNLPYELQQALTKLVPPKA